MVARMIAVLLPLLVLTAPSVLMPGTAHADLAPNGLFSVQRLGSTMKLNDVGIVDLNGDQYLDIFTTNHAARPLILINDKNGGFEDHSLSLPFIRDSAKHYHGTTASSQNCAPDTHEVGLYVFFCSHELIVEFHGDQMYHYADFELIVKDDKFAQSVDQIEIINGNPSEEARTMFGEDVVNKKAILARLNDNESLVVKSTTPYLYKIMMRVANAIPLDNIFLGTLKANPSSHQVEVEFDDQHALAWLDIDDDRVMDAISASGGGRGTLRGRLEEGEGGSFRVFLGEKGYYRELSPFPELSVYGCPTRDLALLDYNGDGDLDVYVNCGRDPSQRDFLFEYKDGAFREVGVSLGLESGGPGMAAWFDVDQDGDWDLLRTVGRSALLYRHRDGQLASESVGSVAKPTRQIAVADWDNDGDDDVYFASENGSRMFKGTDGGLEAVEPDELGLPENSICANWVDYNNDGFVDFFSFPHGLFEQTSDGQFIRTGTLASHDAVSQAYCMWFDADNDGYRDLVVATPQEPGMGESVRREVTKVVNRHLGAQVLDNTILRTWQRAVLGDPFHQPEVWNLAFYRSLGDDAHWLEFELVGDRGNRPAIGSVVRVVTPSGERSLPVGHAEGSRMSAGHYRVYFGLGSDAEIDKVEVVWPDGQVEEIRGITVDRLDKIRRTEQ